MNSTKDANLGPPPARLDVCLRQLGKTYKILWLNESSTGVFVGHFGEVAETHFSYHTDGRTHFKGPQGDLIFDPSNELPISDILGLTRLGAGFTAPVNSLLKKPDRVAHPYTGSARAFQVFLPEFTAFTHLSFGQFLLSNENEEVSVEHLFRMYSPMKDTSILAFICMPLANFPNHKLIVLVTAFIS